MNIKQSQKIIYPVLSVIAFLGIWMIAAVSMGVSIILPTPLEMFKEFFRLLSESSFYTAVSGTLLRTLWSFLIAFSLSLIVAVLCSLYRVLYSILYPIIVILRATPTISIILLSLIWLTSNSSPLLIAFLIIFPMMFTSFYQAILSSDKDLAEMSKVYNVKKTDTLRYFYIPSIASTMFAQITSALTLNVKLIIAAEALAQTRISMGNAMQISKGNLNIAELLAWTVMAILLSYVLELLIILIKKLTVRWKT